MALWCPLAVLCFIALPCLSFVIAERKLLCSSEHISMWYNFEGPLYYLSMALSPCSVGVSLYFVNCTLIPMFTIARFGYRGVVYYKGQMWLEHEEAEVLCEDYKICYIIKGETLNETFPLYITKFDGPKGDYQFNTTVYITDDLGNKMSFTFNFTLEIKSDGNKNNYFFPQLGGL